MPITQMEGLCSPVTGLLLPHISRGALAASECFLGGRPPAHY